MKDANKTKMGLFEGSFKGREIFDNQATLASLRKGLDKRDDYQKAEFIFCYKPLSWRIFDQSQTADIAYAGSLAVTVYCAVTAQATLLWSQKVAAVCVVVHYARRLFESHFMHRYTEERPHPIISWGCILYYWVLFGGVIHYALAPTFSPWFALSTMQATVLGALFLVCDALNFKCHLITRALRRPGTNERGIPQGYGFGLVIMANYMWEGFAWTVFIPLA